MSGCVCRHISTFLAADRAIFSHSPQHTVTVSLVNSQIIQILSGGYPAWLRSAVGKSRDFSAL